MSGAFLGSLLAPAGEAEHGSDYQRARQQYLRTMAGDPKQPRHVRGWATQEANRLQRIAAARAAGRRAPGGDPHRYKGIPGYDVGHKLGKHGQHKPANFRLEWSRDNRARPGHARRLGVQNRWREGEFEWELEQAAEVLGEAELGRSRRGARRGWGMRASSRPPGPYDTTQPAPPRPRTSSFPPTWLPGVGDPRNPAIPRPPRVPSFPDYPLQDGELESELAGAAEALQEAERFDGRGTNRALHRLDTRLVTAAGSAGRNAIRYSQGQVDANGQPVVAGRNPTKPDLSYLTRWNGGDLRVNVEVDTDPQRALGHLAGNRVQDPRALSYALIADPTSGAIIGGRVFDPRYRSGVERRLSRRELNNLTAGTVGRHGLPAPRQAADPGRTPRVRNPISSRSARAFNIRRRR